MSTYLRYHSHYTITEGLVVQYHHHRLCSVWYQGVQSVIAQVQWENMWLYRPKRRTVTLSSVLDVDQNLTCIWGNEDMYSTLSVAVSACDVMWVTTWHWHWHKQSSQSLLQDIVSSWVAYTVSSYWRCSHHSGRYTSLWAVYYTTL